MKNILIVILILGVLGGGYYLYKKSKSTGVQPEPQIQTTVQPTTAATPSAVMEKNTVTLTANGFEPPSITVKAGEKVTWVNKSGQPATVNSDNHPTHLLFPFLNLGSFDDGGTLSVIVEKPGTYTYHNHLNPGDKGTIVAE